MTHSGKILAGVSLSLAFLAGCDGSDGVVGNPVLQFGEAFAAAFNAAPTATPSEPADITFQGVSGVNLTAAPIEI